MKNAYQKGIVIPSLKRFDNSMLMNETVLVLPDHYFTPKVMPGQIMSFRIYSVKINKNTIGLPFCSQS